MSGAARVFPTHGSGAAREYLFVDYDIRTNWIDEDCFILIRSTQKIILQILYAVAVQYVCYSYYC